MPAIRDGFESWRSQLLRIEDLGFDEVAVSEHYTGGWAMEPLAALAFAAANTSRLRILTLVLNNDLRHPAVLAKAMATADVLSAGRVSLGIGAGWLPADYRALGIPFDRPKVRIERLEEGLNIIRSFFAGGTISCIGRHYSVDNLEALPAPVQRSGPPILIGAGGPKMLELAGRAADIVGIHVTLGANGFNQKAAREMSASAIAGKIHRVRAAAEAGGRTPPVFQLTPVVVIVDGRRSTAVRPGFTGYVEAHPEEFADSPAVLVGSAHQIAESIERWNTDLKIELWHLGADVTAVAPILAAVR